MSAKRKTSVKRKGQLKVEIAGKLVTKTLSVPGIKRAQRVGAFEWVAFDVETGDIVAKASDDSLRYFGTRLAHQLLQDPPLQPTLRAALEHAVATCRQELRAAEAQVSRLRQLVDYGTEVMTQLDDRQLELF